MKLARLALALLGLTFCLLLAGGLVHNTRSSLACPDWPLCFGSAFPRMEGGVLIEHGHRLLATSVGLGTIILVFGLASRARKTGEHRLTWLGVAALALVVFQGVLGGLTVIYRLPTLVSTAHLATSMLFFSLLIYINFRLRPTPPRTRAALPPTVATWSAIATATVYLQMLLGALMRHLGAGLACTDLPLCRGEVWPAGAHPNVLLHVTHRLAALAVLFVTIMVARVTWRAGARPLVRALALIAPLLTLVQGTLGVLSITSFLDAAPVTAHLGVAALLLADLFCLHLVAREVPARVAAMPAERAISLDGVAA